MSGRLGHRLGVGGRVVRAAHASFVVAFYVFLLAPIVIVILFSFADAAFVTFPIEELSLRWYRRMIEYRPFLTSLAFSLEVALAAAVLSALVGVPAALALSRARTGFSEALMTLLLAPLSMPMVLLGVALLYYLSWLGLGISVTSLLIGHTVVAIPYVTRSVAAVHRGVGRSYEEAARILGADAFRTFLFVTLPLIRPGLISGMLFAALVSLDNLPVSLFFAGSTTNTLPVVMLAYQQNQFDPAIGAISAVQMVVTVAILLIVQKVTGLHHVVSDQSGP